MWLRRGEEEEFRADLTPLIDVVFLLVVFFMVSTVFVEFRRQVIVLPEPRDRHAQEQLKAHVVEIKAEDRVFLDGEEVTLDTLTEKLKTAPDRASVVIRADEALSYGLVMRVMETCRNAGIADIWTALQ